MVLQRPSATSPGSPVTITVTARDAGDEVVVAGETRRRSLGLTSPVPRSVHSSTTTTTNPQATQSSPAPTGPRSPYRRSSLTATTTTSATNLLPQSVSPSRSPAGSRYNLYTTAASSKDACEEVSSSSGFVRYTVQIPPTPQDQLSPSSTKPERSYISGTIFTGGFNCVTRGHVIDCSADGSSPKAVSKSMAMACRMRGCDERAFLCKGKLPCECGFVICKDCYLDCTHSGGQCPGCKEPYRDANTDDEQEEGEEHDEEDDEHVHRQGRRGGRGGGRKGGDGKEDKCQEHVLPLTSMADFRPNRRLSIMKSTKAPHEFDHARWLFETKGTYGYGNAVWPKDDGHGGGGGGMTGMEDPPNFGQRNKRPLTRKIPISTAILSPYRLLVLIRLISLGFFLSWRITHPNHQAMWLWGMSVTCEVWFAVSWLLDQLPKLCPVNRTTDLSILKDRFECPSARNPKGRSDLPGVDVFVSTADPEKEPPLVTANTILSILAVDYPVEKLACYLSDDGGALLTFEALAETASFAKIWVPFCRKHCIEPRNPEAYFSQKRDFLKNKVRQDFVRERRRVKREYDEFKVRVNSLPESIRRRSDAYNAHEELRAKSQYQSEIAKGNGGTVTGEVKVVKATWMSDGSHWPGMWSSAEPDHSRGDHAGIIQVMLAPPTSELQTGSEPDDKSPIDSTCVDIRLPMLVYVSREKRPGYDHNKKAGAMNSLVRTSAIMSNGPFVLNLDCDHYINNSLAIREGMCFMLDRGGDRIAYVQFPQRFEGIDPNDRYANHNTVFFDVCMRALDGLQGPMYVGTGCIFRRTALYGFSPPRATEHLGWFGSRKIKKKLMRMARRQTTMNKKRELEVMDGSACDEEMGCGVIPPFGDDGEEYYGDCCSRDEKESKGLLQLIPKRFGNSSSLVASIPVAEFQGRLLQDVQGVQLGRPAGSLAIPREPLDAATVAEAISVISCFYEDKTEWGRRVGWIYGSVTEDVVTGYRMHNRGWRSVYCVTKRDAFRGTAPINLTDRLHQVLRWATGSVEIFFSRNNALFATSRMKFLQRVAYFNCGLYPFTSIFLLAYCILPAMSLFTGQFIVHSLSATFLSFLLAITVTLCLLAVLEIRWSGITLHDWWRNEQFWLIGGTSAHPAAVLQGLLKVIAGVDISFTLTSKPASDDNDEASAFAELYEVRWSFLMVPPVTIMMVNGIAIAVGVSRTIYSEFPQWSKLLGGVFFSVWVLSHLYPFAKGLMGRRGKIPTIIFVWSGLISIVVSLLWVYISPPSGKREDYMTFRFP